MDNVYIGVDNGVTGSIGIINVPLNRVYYFHIPVERCLYYTKKKAWIKKVSVDKVFALLAPFGKLKTMVAVERPMVNPGRWTATISALFAYDRIEYILQKLGLPYRYVDSKEWQKVLLPKGLKNNELKEASLQIGKRLFPQIDFAKFKDADGLLIAEWMRRTKK